MTTSLAESFSLCISPVSANGTTRVFLVPGRPRDRKLIERKREELNSPEFAARTANSFRRRPVRYWQLVQLRILRLGFLQDGDVGVGVFPKRQKILIGGSSPRCISGDRISAA
jgi:hypothetical protein